MPFRLASSSSIHASILRLLPDVEFCFAYGSGVFQQHANPVTRRTMLDYIVAVRDSPRWHADNLARNPRHYSPLRFAGGAHTITRVQRDFGAACYYNTLVPFADDDSGRKQLFKYGVIELDDLLDDLSNWRYMYAAGRLQKPVLVVGKRPDADSALAQALEGNLQSAIGAALLMLPDSFSKHDAYLVIASLSFYGDFRVVFGDDRNKVRNLVAPNVEAFDQVYFERLRRHAMLEFDEQSGEFVQRASNSTRFALLKALPRHLREAIVLNQMEYGRNRDVNSLLVGIACKVDCYDVVRCGIERVSVPVNRSQSLKGLLTAGASKSVRYTARKLGKMVRSWIRTA